jgi:transcriptional regulator with XRE-family HTH domain
MSKPSAALLSAAHHTRANGKASLRGISAFSGSRMLELRQRYNISQQALSKLVGVGRTQIVNIEAGEGNPSLETLRRLAYHFGVTTDWLLGMDEYEPETDGQS